MRLASAALIDEDHVALHAHRPEEVDDVAVDGARRAEARPAGEDEDWIRSAVRPLVGSGELACSSGSV